MTVSQILQRIRTGVAGTSFRQASPAGLAHDAFVDVVGARNRVRRKYGANCSVARNTVAPNVFSFQSIDFA